MGEPNKNSHSLDTFFGTNLTAFLESLKLLRQLKDGIEGEEVANSTNTIQELLKVLQQQSNVEKKEESSNITLGSNSLSSGNPSVDHSSTNLSSSDSPSCSAAKNSLNGNVQNITKSSNFLAGGKFVSMNEELKLNKYNLDFCVSEDNTCLFCEKKFIVKKCLINHIQLKHLNSFSFCAYCSSEEKQIVFPSEEHLFSHMESFHRIPVVKIEPEEMCKEESHGVKMSSQKCEEKIKSEKKLSEAPIVNKNPCQHSDKCKLEEKNVNSYKKSCYSTTPSNCTGLKNTVKIEKIDKKVTNSSCPFCFKKVKNIMKHIKIAHCIKKEFICDLCTPAIYFAKKSVLQEHGKIHSSNCASPTLCQIKCKKDDPCQSLCSDVFIKGLALSLKKLLKHGLEKSKGEDVNNEKISENAKNKKSSSSDDVRSQQAPSCLPISVSKVGIVTEKNSQTSPLNENNNLKLSENGKAPCAVIKSSSSTSENLTTNRSTDGTCININKTDISSDKNLQSTSTEVKNIIQSNSVPKSTSETLTTLRDTEKLSEEVNINFMYEHINRIKAKNLSGLNAQGQFSKKHNRKPIKVQKTEIEVTKDFSLFFRRSKSKDDRPQTLTCEYSDEDSVDGCLKKENKSNSNNVSLENCDIQSISEDPKQEIKTSLESRANLESLENFVRILSSSMTNNECVDKHNSNSSSSQNVFFEIFKYLKISEFDAVIEIVNLLQQKQSILSRNLGIPLENVLRIKAFEQLLQREGSGNNYNPLQLLKNFVNHGKCNTSVNVSWNEFLKTIFDENNSENIQEKSPSVNFVSNKVFDYPNLTLKSSKNEESLVTTQSQAPSPGTLKEPQFCLESFSTCNNELTRSKSGNKSSSLNSCNSEVSIINCIGQIKEKLKEPSEEIKKLSNCEFKVSKEKMSTLKIPVAKEGKEGTFQGNYDCSESKKIDETDLRKEKKLKPVKNIHDCCTSENVKIDETGSKKGNQLKLEKNETKNKSIYLANSLPKDTHKHATIVNKISESSNINSDTHLRLNTPNKTKSFSESANSYKININFENPDFSKKDSQKQSETIIVEKKTCNDQSNDILKKNSRETMKEVSKSFSPEREGLKVGKVIDKTPCTKTFEEPVFNMNDNVEKEYSLKFHEFNFKSCSDPLLISKTIDHKVPSVHSKKPNESFSEVSPSPANDSILTKKESSSISIKQRGKKLMKKNKKTAFSKKMQKLRTSFCKGSFYKIKNAVANFSAKRKTQLECEKSGKDIDKTSEKKLNSEVNRCKVSFEKVEKSPLFDKSPSTKTSDEARNFKEMDADFNQSITSLTKSCQGLKGLKPNNSSFEGSATKIKTPQPSFQASSTSQKQLSKIKKVSSQKIMKKKKELSKMNQRLLSSSDSIKIKVSPELARKVAKSSNKSFSQTSKVEFFEARSPAKINGNLEVSGVCNVSLESQSSKQSSSEKKITIVIPARKLKPVTQPKKEHNFKKGTISANSVHSFKVIKLSNEKAHLTKTEQSTLSSHHGNGSMNRTNSLKGQDVFEPQNNDMSPKKRQSDCSMQNKQKTNSKIQHESKSPCLGESAIRKSDIFTPWCKPQKLDLPHVKSSKHRLEILIESKTGKSFKFSNFSNENVSQANTQELSPCHSFCSEDSSPQNIQDFESSDNHRHLYAKSNEKLNKSVESKFYYTEKTPEKIEIARTNGKQHFSQPNSPLLKESKSKSESLSVENIIANSSVQTEKNISSLRKRSSPSADKICGKKNLIKQNSISREINDASSSRKIHDSAKFPFSSLFKESQEISRKLSPKEPKLHSSYQSDSMLLSDDSWDFKRKNTSSLEDAAEISSELLSDVNIHLECLELPETTIDLENHSTEVEVNGRKPVPLIDSEKYMTESLKNSRAYESKSAATQKNKSNASTLQSKSARKVTDQNKPRSVEASFNNHQKLPDRTDIKSSEIHITVGGSNQQDQGRSETMCKNHIVDDENLSDCSKIDLLELPLTISPNCRAESSNCQAALSNDQAVSSHCHAVDLKTNKRSISKPSPRSTYEPTVKKTKRSPVSPEFKEESDIWLKKTSSIENCGKDKCSEKLSEEQPVSSKLYRNADHPKKNKSGSASSGRENNFRHGIDSLASDSEIGIDDIFPPTTRRKIPPPSSRYVPNSRYPSTNAQTRTRNNLDYHNGQYFKNQNNMYCNEKCDRFTNNQFYDNNYKCYSDNLPNQYSNYMYNSRNDDLDYTFANNSAYSSQNCWYDRNNYPATNFHATNKPSGVISGKNPRISRKFNHCYQEFS